MQKSASQLVVQNVIVGELIILKWLVDNVKFKPIDLVCVTRRNQSSNTRIWHYRAQKFNFFLRGFKYLILAKKPTDKGIEVDQATKIKWQRYK